MTAELPSQTDVVQAAGGLVVRRQDEQLEIALVHRPVHHDWSFPKGKLEAGETLDIAALRGYESVSLKPFDLFCFTSGRFIRQVDSYRGVQLRVLLDAEQPFAEPVGLRRQRIEQSAVEPRPAAQRPRRRLFDQNLAV